MKDDIVIICEIKKGVFMFSYKQQRVIERVGDGEIELIIGKPQRKRSIQQNRWYWGVAIPTIIEGTENPCSKSLKPPTQSKKALHSKICWA